MRVGRLQTVTAIVMAYAVLLILVSPIVPSPLTTVRSKQTVQPPQTMAPVTSLLYTAVLDLHAAAMWLMHHPGTVVSHGTDIVDLTTARLC